MRGISLHVNDGEDMRPVYGRAYRDMVVDIELGRQTDGIYITFSADGWLRQLIKDHSWQGLYIQEIRW